MNRFPAQPTEAPQGRYLPQQPVKPTEEAEMEGDGNEEAEMEGDGNEQEDDGDDTPNKKPKRMVG